MQGAIFLLEGPADVRVGGDRGKLDEKDDCVYCRVVKYLLSRGNEYLFLHTKTAFVFSKSLTGGNSRLWPRGVFLLLLLLLLL